MRAEDLPAQPWFRELWPWLLLAGPAIVVVAGAVTAWLAISSNDGLVIDDYYKEGLAINRTVGRGEAAARRGIRAQLTLADDRIRVLLGAPAGRGALTLRMVHPTRSGMDQSVDLDAVQPGEYAGRLRPLAPGRWHVVLEGAEWRLTGDWALPSAGALTLGSRRSEPPGTDTSKERR